MIFQDDLTEYKNGEDNDCPLQMLAFIQPTTVDKEPNFILFENLFKPRQLHLAVYMLLTSSVLSTTSKQYFEQPAASFLVCYLIFIEY